MGRISRSYPKGKLKLRAPKKAQPDKKYQIYIEYNWQADNARKSTGISVFAKEWNDKGYGGIGEIPPQPTQTTNTTTMPCTSVSKTLI